ncbi:hypothetical protein [Brevundimonas subvibrioides]|nr:hypothetical protein [Brevundimonas subvibrioides]
MSRAVGPKLIPCGEPWELKYRKQPRVARVAVAAMAVTAASAEMGG